MRLCYPTKLPARFPSLWNRLATRSSPAWGYTLWG
jgi:hypothetical protein